MSVVRKQQSKYSIFISFPCKIPIKTNKSQAIDIEIASCSVPQGGMEQNGTECVPYGAKEMTAPCVIVVGAPFVLRYFR